MLHIKNYNINEFYMFMQKAKIAKYIALEKKCNRKKAIQVTEHENIVYSEYGFCMTDKYYLGDPFSGQEIVKYRSRPIWIMNYLGEKPDPEEDLPLVTILELVKMTIMATYQAGGINGSIIYTKHGYRYLVESVAECSMYDGKGYIYRKDKQLYRLTYYGGIVSV